MGGGLNNTITCGRGAVGEGSGAWVDMDRGWSLTDKIDFLEYAVFGWLPHSEKVAEAIQQKNIVPIMKTVKYFKE